jgi:hypothetical protein
MYRGLKVFLSLAVDGDDWSHHSPSTLSPKKQPPLYWEHLEIRNLEYWLVHHLSRYTKSLHAETGIAP